MKVCDICKNPSYYNISMVTDPNNGAAQSADLCLRCYRLFKEKENKYRFLAYQETVEERTNKQVKKTLLQRLKFKE